MLRVFGGWQGYIEAPAMKVEEQRIVWIAELQAAAERDEEERRRASK